MPFEKRFEQEGPFKAWSACCDFLNSHGYSYGSTCVMNPVGVLKGDFAVAKWRNLSQKERSALDGIVVGNFRNGPLTLSLKVAPEGVQA